MRGHVNQETLYAIKAIESGNDAAWIRDNMRWAANMNEREAQIKAMPLILRNDFKTRARVEGLFRLAYSQRAAAKAVEAIIAERAAYVALRAKENGEQLSMFS